MFRFIKRSGQKKGKTLEQTRKWRSNALFQDCLTALRGACTVVSSDHQAACEAVVFDAQTGGSWKAAAMEDLNGQPLPDTVYILWDEPSLPVLRCPGPMAMEHIADVTAVSTETWLISESMEQIIHFTKDGTIRISGQ